jgi:hypothetical protein
MYAPRENVGNFDEYSAGLKIIDYGPEDLHPCFFPSILA